MRHSGREPEDARAPTPTPGAPWEQPTRPSTDRFRSLVAHQVPATPVPAAPTVRPVDSERPPAAPAAPAVPVPSPALAPTPPPSPAPAAGPHEGSRIGLVARAVIVVSSTALLLGALAVAHAGPFTSSPATTAPTAPTVAPTAPTATAGAVIDIRGTWSMLVVFDATLSPQRLVVTAENRSTGVFSGTVQTTVGVEAVTGKMSGTTLSFTITLGSGTETGTASITTDGAVDHLNGRFISPSGVTGTLSATRQPG